jgi:hypothetical protein
MPIDSARLLALLLNAAAQITVIGVGAALALWLSRNRPARIKYRLAVAGLLSCAIVPLFCAWPQTEPGRGMAVGVPIDTREWLESGIAGAALWAYGAWLLWKTAAVAHAMGAARSLHRTCAPTLDGVIAVAFDRFKRGDRSIAISQSPLAESPLVCGVIRPTIVFPEHFPTSDFRVVDAVLAHEYAHVVRMDIAFAMAIELLTLPFAVHPVIAALKRAAARYREVACDEMAISDLGIDKRVYAHALVRLAECPFDTPPTAAAVGAHLASRIERLLKPPHQPSVRAAGPLASLTLLAAVAIAPWSAIAVDAPWLELAGSWMLDLDESRVRGHVPFQSARLRIDLSGSDVRIVQNRTRSNGRYETFEIRGAADNQPFRVLLPANARAQTRARWADNRLITDSVGPGFRWREHSELTVIGNRLIVRIESSYDERRSLLQLVFRKDPAEINKTSS